MKVPILLFLYTISSIILYAQDTSGFYSSSERARIANEIKKEAMILYHSEMASSLATDILFARHEDIKKIGGYFSYPEKEFTQCVFYSKGENPMVLFTILFDSTFKAERTLVGIAHRNFNEKEKVYYLLRHKVLDTIKKRTFFITYVNSKFYIVPVVDTNRNDVYVMTAAKEDSTICYGNDYLIHFNNKLAVISVEKLHSDLIAMTYKKQQSRGNKVTRAYHTHLPGYNPFITATDICITMLYKNLSHSDKVEVVSEKYGSIWTCKDEKLIILTIDELKNMSW